MKCLKCETEMINTETKINGEDVSLCLVSRKRGMIEIEQKSEVNCYVCPKCGYTEFQAKNPKGLIIE